MSARPASPVAVSKALRVRTAAALTFLDWAIQNFEKIAQERPDLAETVQYKNAEHDLASLKRAIKEEQF